MLSISSVAITPPFSLSNYVIIFEDSLYKFMTSNKMYRSTCTEKR